jgi:predicted transglutaminase-like cysteine proteinase
MSRLHRSRRGALLLALVFTFASTGVTLARQNIKKTPQRHTPSLSVDGGAAAAARYFTINQVLAKRDTQRTPAAAALLASTTTTVTDAPPPGHSLLPSSEPFGLATFRAPEGLLWVKWRDIEQHLKVEAVELERCRDDRAACPSQALHFLRLVEAARALDGRARLEMVNRAVNAAVRYTTDFAQHGVADRWTAPLATLAAARGDCEDYAIAKYAILRAAGVAVSDLRLLLVRDRAVRQDHAVLAVRENGRWLVLDNRHPLLVETTALPQFTPLFALDHEGVSLFAAPYVNRTAPFGFEPAGVAGARAAASEPDAGAPAAAATVPYLL